MLNRRWEQWATEAQKGVWSSTSSRVTTLLEAPLNRPMVLLGLRPYTPHPTPYTLHPTPYTLTLHPAAHTLHLTPYTLHLKLQTLNPKPWNRPMVLLGLRPSNPHPNPQWYQGVGCRV